MSLCCVSITCPPVQFPVGLCGMYINEVTTPTICKGTSDKQNQIDVQCVNSSRTF